MAGFAVKAIDHGSPFSKRLEYSGSNVIYVGEAYPKTLVSDAKWRIYKLTYSGDNVTEINWASGNDNFDKVWNSRTSYVYS